eukprot:TRINITY_DN5278_c0_g1_i4.p1 TRINITY_DN5278_c0_g1~~TRINITY_DN5278_c0_g1_i4.p1  ORF type:complete len:511 (+),score=102.61 TRINITY_DN5278_c0_g1_i4:334-1866(+)
MLALLFLVAAPSVVRTQRCPPNYVGTTSDKLGQVPEICFELIGEDDLRAIDNAGACAAMTSGQVSHLGSKHPHEAACAGFSAQCLHQLSSATLAALPPVHCFELIPNDAFSQLTADQIADLGSNLASHLSKDQIANINSGACAGFSGDQIEVLGTSWQMDAACSGLSLDCINQWEAGKMNRLQAQCVSQFRDDYFSKLSNESVYAMSRTGISGMLSVHFLKFIQTYGVQAIDGFTFEQLSFVPLLTIEGFHKFWQFGVLSAEQNRTVVVNGSLVGLSWLHFSFSSNESAGEVTSDLLHVVQTDVTLGGLRGGHAAYLSNDAFGAISHLPVFAADFVKAITPVQVQRLPCTAFVNFLGGIVHLSPDNGALQAVSPAQWDGLFNSVDIEYFFPLDCQGYLRHLSEKPRELIANYSSDWQKAFENCPWDSTVRFNFTGEDLKECSAAHHATEAPTTTSSPSHGGGSTGSPAGVFHSPWVIALTIAAVALVLIVGGFVYSRLRRNRRREGYSRV